MGLVEISKEYFKRSLLQNNDKGNKNNNFFSKIKMSSK